MLKNLSLSLVLSSTAIAAMTTTAIATTATLQYEIAITLPVIEQGQYHRPYVALWVENEQKVVQRSVLVWMEKDRWLSDLSRYWRRVARANRDIVDGVTGATKGPGTHHVSWDGLDDSGKPLPAGQYVICVEVAREKGGREAICTDIDYGTKQVAIAQGEFEVSRLTVTLK